MVNDNDIELVNLGCLTNVEGKSFGGSKDSSTLWLSLSFIGPLGSFFDKS